MAPEADERRPLLNNDDATSPTTKRRSSSKLVRFLYRINPLVSRRPWRLFEICDLSVFPSFLRRRCQAMLTAQWTHRLPLIQSQSPAELAAELITKSLEELEHADSETNLTVIDFCSGGGGPVPTIEKLVNAKRKQRGKPPLSFVLSDIKPHIDAWIEASTHSAHLSFIPQPVDATTPPPAVISSSSSFSSSTANNNTANADFSSDTRVFRLYCLAFHHFDDELAQGVLKSTLETADGFAILELQDRSLFSCGLMVLDFFLVLLVTPFWFWRDPLQIMFTYIIPVLPLVLSFDGTVSCLRTRTFGEVMELVDGSGWNKAGPSGEEIKRVVDEDGMERQAARRGKWVFMGGSELHTWPYGYMNWIVGRQIR